MGCRGEANAGLTVTGAIAHERQLFGAASDRVWRPLTRVSSTGLKALQRLASQMTNDRGCLSAAARLRSAAPGWTIIEHRRASGGCRNWRALRLQARPCVTLAAPQAPVVFAGHGGNGRSAIGARVGKAPATSRKLSLPRTEGNPAYCNVLNYRSSAGMP
jgi:hypothetical protein